MVFSAAISLYCQLASQGAAFTSFKLSLLTLASPQKASFFYYFFAFSCLYACCSASENGFAYSFTPILSIAISCISYSRIYFDSTYIISFTPKMSVSKLIFQICMSVKHHQCWLPFQISHKCWYRQWWRYHYQHMYIVPHQMSFYYFYMLVST